MTTEALEPLDPQVHVSAYRETLRHLLGGLEQ
jgi:hypothetical protein